MNHTPHCTVMVSWVSFLALGAAGWLGWLAGQRSAASQSMAQTSSRGRMQAKTAAAPAPPTRVPEGWAPSRFPVFSDPDIFRESGLVQRAASAPHLVMAEVMGRPAGPERNAEIVLLLRGWVMRDPVAAAEWLADLDPRETPELPLGDIEPLFSTAPAEARAKGVLGFLAAKAESRTLLDAAQGYTSTDVNRAYANRKRNSDHLVSDEDHVSTFGSQLNARAHALAVWAAREPEQALEWVRSRQNADARQWLMNTLIGSLASSGAADQAIDLYNSEPDLHEQGALRSLGKAWAASDPTAALTWSNSIPDLTLRDEFIAASLSECPAGQAPELLEFTSSITDPKRRRQTREFLLAQAVWHQAAAREWLRTDPSLDDSERSHLQTRLEAAARKAR